MYVSQISGDVNLHINTHVLLIIYRLILLRLQIYFTTTTKIIFSLSKDSR